MTRFFVGAPELGRPAEISFAEFIHQATGRSIVSGADWGGGRFELGLSGETMLRLERHQGGLDVHLFSTTNRGEVPPLVIELPEEARRLPMRAVEARLRALRTLHAVVHLLETGRFDDIEHAITENQDFDTYLADADQLYLESLSPGSWVLTVWAKAQGSYKSLLYAASMVYVRGREAFLRKLEAETRLKELEVEEREFKLLQFKMDYGMELAQKLQPDTRAKLHDVVEQQVRALLPSSTTVEVGAAADRFITQASVRARE